jgi:hypothetical protein
MSTIARPSPRFRFVSIAFYRMQENHRVLTSCAATTIDSTLLVCTSCQHWRVRQLVWRMEGGGRISDPRRRRRCLSRGVQRLDFRQRDCFVWYQKSNIKRSQTVSFQPWARNLLDNRVSLIGVRFVSDITLQSTYQMYVSNAAFHVQHAFIDGYLFCRPVFL